MTQSAPCSRECTAFSLGTGSVYTPQFSQAGLWLAAGGRGLRVVDDALDVVDGVVERLTPSTSAPSPPALYDAACGVSTIVVTMRATTATPPAMAAPMPMRRLRRAFASRSRNSSSFARARRRALLLDAVGFFA